MTLSDDEKHAVRTAIEAVHNLNAALSILRSMKIAANIREEGNQWYLDAKPIIRKEHYS